MKISFWNNNKKKSNDTYIIDLINEHELDLMLLCEYNHSSDGITSQLKYYNEISLSSKREFKIIANTNREIKSSVIESNFYFQIIKIVDEYDEEFLIFLVHFPSPLNADINTRDDTIRSFKSYIDETKKRLNIEKIVIVGDFNIHPFDNSMITAGGFNAIYHLSRNKKDRKMRYVNYDIYYNPMWKNYSNKVCGTYYLDNSQSINLYWNMFDQVILNYHSLDYLINNDVTIITEINNVSILKNEKPNSDISDHLPLLFELRKE